MKPDVIEYIDKVINEAFDIAAIPRYVPEQEALGVPDILPEHAVLATHGLGRRLERTQAQHTRRLRVMFDGNGL
ncbi:MAG TPA: hypothetical protein VMR28_02285 [Candidatus Saccharimonadales bacterium]|nr:hypothetical protein [Candidatus Saccharimonadales bacterium]